MKPYKIAPDVRNGDVVYLDAEGVLQRYNPPAEPTTLPIAHYISGGPLDAKQERES